MPMLNRLTVKGFKSIEACELDLQRLNVVIGPNGAGKSNSIGVFRFLNSVLNRHQQRSGHPPFCAHKAADPDVQKNIG